MRSSFRKLVLGLTALSSSMGAQQRSVSPQIQTVLSVNAPVVALTHVRLIDGTGAPARDDQSIIVEGELIRAVGKTGEVQVPQGAQVLDLTGHTVIPGIVGLHDHMYYSSAASGSMKMMFYSYPRLFLASGVTTIRTAGSTDSYRELNLKKAIDDGSAIGPDIVVTGPYLQGPVDGPAGMHALAGAEDARRMVRYWAEEGVTWFKAYTTISRAELGAAIDEAHKRGVKVTAHLCSVGFLEAVALGIDNLEHGLLTNSEYNAAKQPDSCPGGSAATYAALDIASPAVQRTIQEMVRKNVSLTSTLAVYETGSPSRVPFDQRVLDALFPAARDAVALYYERGRTSNDSLARKNLRKAMDFERSFVNGGGLLAAGADPCCASAIAGYADQRNFELLVEAGFTPVQAVQIMTLNGAKVLGKADRVGSVAAGKQADLVIIRGDPSRTPGDIRNVVTVFRKGLGYDSAKLTASVAGQVGLR
ncbi:MAG: amidohydrolase family protein [Gemmatimonadaceae bacterium]